jgi:Sec-independent protein translocase protein TatA
MMLLLIIGLLLYGRNLPQAGRTMGRFVSQLKRGFQDFKDQMDRDESLREVRKTIQDTTREMRNLTNVPRAVIDPANALRELTHEAMHAPVSDGARAEQPVTAPGEPADEQPDEPQPPPPTSPQPSAPANATSQP